MSGDDAYLGWEDLLDEPDSSGPPTPPVDPRSDTRTPPDLALPAEVQALLDEQKRLENDLKALTGQAEPTPDDLRREKCFPVREHTRESRIEDRRLAKRDEALRAQARDCQANRKADGRRQAKRQLERETQNRERLAENAARRKEARFDYLLRRQREEDRARRRQTHTLEQQAQAKNAETRKQAAIKLGSRQRQDEKRDEQRQRARMNEYLLQKQTREYAEKRLWETRTAQKKRRLEQGRENAHNLRLEEVRERRLAQLRGDKLQERQYWNELDEHRRQRQQERIQDRRTEFQRQSPDPGFSDRNVSQLTQQRRAEDREQARKDRALQQAVLRRKQRWN